MPTPYMVSLFASSKCNFRAADASGSTPSERLVNGAAMVGTSAYILLIPIFCTDMFAPMVSSKDVCVKNGTVSSKWIFEKGQQYT